MDKEIFNKEFIVELQEKAQEHGGTLQVYPAIPEQGVLQGIAFQFEGTPIATMLYPDLFYPHYTKTAGMKPLVQSAMSSVLGNKPIDIDAYEITKENAPERLVAAVVNYNKNRAMLRDVPHEKFLDLAIIAKWAYQPGYRVEVTDWILSNLNMTKEEALSIAKKNTFAGINELQTLEKEDACLYEPEDYAKPKKNPFQKKMYVLSTEGYQEGAAAIADRKTLDKIHKQLGEDFYILPVTDFRVLVVKESDCSDPYYLMQQVLDEQRVMYDWQKTLSTEPYKFDGRELHLAREQNLNVADAIADKITHHRGR